VWLAVLLISPPAMICQVRRADVIQYSRGLIPPSLHALIENLPLVASAGKGRLTLALRQVAVTIFNLTLSGIGYYRRLLNDWGLNNWGLLAGASR